MINKTFYLLMIFIFSSYSAQKNNNFGKVTEKLIKLYLKENVTSQQYIGVTVYEDTISKGMTIETLKDDFSLYKKTPIYKWFQYNGSKIIIFCDFSNEKCNKIFNSISFNQDNSGHNILDKEPISYELDGSIRQWSIRLNNDIKINRVNGEFIKDEIRHPKLFKSFLKRNSVLKLYQLSVGGSIITPM